jgi:hypothetical protein
MIRKLTAVFVGLAVVSQSTALLAQTKLPPKARLLREQLEPINGAPIPAPLNTEKPFVVTHIPVADCRAVRGFFGAPIDGSLDSRDYADKRWEYNFDGQQADCGVKYTYLKNDGLHVTLSDNKGVHAIQIRGGVRANVVTDCVRYDDANRGKPLVSFDVANARYTAAYFEQPVTTDKFSFFNVKDGYIADVGFFRVGGDTAALGEAIKSPVGGAADIAALGGFLEARYERTPSPTYAAFTASPAEVADLQLKDKASVHIIAGPFQEDLPISAVGLEVALDGVAAPTSLIVQVQDPIHPRTAVTTVALGVGGSGKLNLALDIPDQIVPKGRVLWLTLRSPDNLTLKAPTLVLYKVSRDQALPGALAYRLLKLKGFWLPMSESRPWNVMPRNADVEQWLAKIKDPDHRMLIAELRDAIEHCHWLNATDAIARQYYEWFYRRKNRPELPPAQIIDDPGAPEWAVVARTAWLTARIVPDWWVRNRLVPSGEFGGSDDDGSMYQNFASFPLFESDGVAAKLKEGAAHRAELDQKSRLSQGLNKDAQDLLHSYENGLNQQSLVTWWHYGDPIYIERCMLTARNSETLTMVNAAGHRHFKSQTVGVIDLRVERKPDQDSGFSAQMMHPLCEAVFYNHNPRALKLLRELGDSWVDHLTKAELGKYPTGVDVVTDNVTETDWEAFSGGFGNHAAMMAFLTRTTGDDKYLRPLVDFYAKSPEVEYTANYLADVFSLGAMDKSPEAIQKRQKDLPAFLWMTTGDKAPLLAALKEDISEIQTFGHMYTTVEPFTDRIFLYAIINPALAYTGGFATRNKMYHSQAVTWDGFSTDYAALVRTSRRDQFHAIVFNFRNEPIRGNARFWLLDHGLYEMTTGIDENGDDQIDGAATTKEIEIIRADAVPLELPPRKVTVITLKQKTKLDPIEERADLALAAREITVKDGVVEGVAHNIGSKDVADAVVALVDASGATVKKISLGKLDAPLDLMARRVDFKLEGVPAERAGWRVVLDPDNAVPEITESNNSVLLP